MVRALARLALQQGPSIKVLRQDTMDHLSAAWSHYEFTLATVPGGTTVEAESAKGSRGPATEKCAHHVPAPAPAQAAGQSAGATTHQGQAEHLAQGGKWQYQTWSPSLGALIADERDPLSNHDVVEMLFRVIPFLGTPFMVNRFHANGGLKETNIKVAAFQLEISNNTPGCQDVWQVLEKLRGLSALQLIGMQMKRDSLRQSPAADAVQKLSLGFAN